MFLSMTGFASKSYEFSWGTVLFEISSVNHKYQDFIVKLPPELLSLENKILDLMRRLIVRGRVKLSAEITWASGANIPVLDEEGIMNLYNQVKRITKRNNIEAAPDLASLLLIPGVLNANTNLAARAAHEAPEVWNKIVREVIEALFDMREAEGVKLKIKIEEDLGELEKILAEMESRWQAAKDLAIESIRSRIENVLEHYKLELDEARIAEEVALASDRWDISEEITRMKSHTEKFKNFIDAKESTGRKLDFLLQEMNREVNTMGSKVQDALFRWDVVEAKTIIERIREQVQNIE